MKKVINYLRGIDTDDKDRYMFDTLILPDDELEKSNDIFCWWFPIDTRLKDNLDAFIISIDDFNNIIKKDGIILEAINFALTRVVWFYENDNQWLTKDNHNFIRIARILRCLWLVGMKKEYVKFQKSLDKLFTQPQYKQIIGMRTFFLWKCTCDDIIWLKTSVFVS